MKKDIIPNYITVKIRATPRRQLVLAEYLRLRNEMSALKEKCAVAKNLVVELLDEASADKVSCGGFLINRTPISVPQKTTAPYDFDRITVKGSR